MRLNSKVNVTNTLTDLRLTVFKSLASYLNAEQIDGARRCAMTLVRHLPKGQSLDRSTVLVAYGGGKDSSYTLTFVRLVQLILFHETGETFHLRSVTNRHAGMPMAVMANIDRAYTALGLNEDPYAELLLIDGNEVASFACNRPLPTLVRDRNRLDILMNGHRTQADPRPTFCNACNLSMINSFGLAAQFAGGVDIIITGDSPREQRTYAVWVKRLAQQMDQALSNCGDGFDSFLKTLNVLSERYYEELYGPQGQQEIQARRIADSLRRVPLFFSIYDYASYSLADHWSLVTEFLAFDFDELAFNFSESDCGNPGLMAHLRGLKCERLFMRTYEEGIREYVGFGVSLMESKHFPAILIRKILARYETPLAISLMRQRATHFAMEAFGLDDKKLICMIYAPFTEQGRNLALYLERECPELVSHLDEIHRLLGQTSENGTTTLASDLEEISGLTLSQLRQCYRSALVDHHPDPGTSSLITKILKRDPHKAVIKTRHHPDGPVVDEQISGR